MAPAGTGLAGTRLLERACQKLRCTGCCARPIGTLERLVGSLAEQTHREPSCCLRPLFDQPGLVTTLDALLDTPTARTRHRWLCQAATMASPRALTHALAKQAFLQQIGALAWDTSGLYANRQKHLARLVRARRNNYFQRLSPKKHYLALMAFLVVSLKYEQKTPLRDLALLVTDWPLATIRPLPFFYSMEELLHPCHPLDKCYQPQLYFLRVCQKHNGPITPCCSD